MPEYKNNSLVSKFRPEILAFQLQQCVPEALTKAICIIDMALDPVYKRQAFAHLQLTAEMNLHFQRRILQLSRFQTASQTKCVYIFLTKAEPHILIQLWLESIFLTIEKVFELENCGAFSFNNALVRNEARNQNNSKTLISYSPKCQRHSLCS